jgi:exonuclease SbcD
MKKIKKPLTICSTDWHLNKDNLEQIKDLVRQKIALANRYDIKTVFLLGDVYTSRKAIEEFILNTFGEILDMFKDAGIKLICIAGNHDKINQEKKESYLTPFRNHPNFMLIELCGGIPIGDIMFHMVPYFKDEVYVEQLDSLIEYIGKENFKTKKRFLLTHQSVNGVKNNDGTKVVDGFDPDVFDLFDKVLVGHYHNRSKVGENVYYIGSIAANNFGEDNEKGFTLVYDDGSLGFEKSKFKEYHKFTIDLSKDTYTKLIDEHKTSDNNIRFEFVGKDEDFVQVDIDMIKSLGIDVKRKRQDVEATICVAEQDEVIEFDSITIMSEFDKFCAKENVADMEFGKSILKQALNK